MYPTEITQGERQLVLYKTNANYYSRYTSQTQKTTVTLPTDRSESYSQTPKPVAKSEQTITYGPYENVAALTRKQQRISHCQHAQTLDRSFTLGKHRRRRNH